jgi:hypothetical protein
VPCVLDRLLALAHGSAVPVHGNTAGYIDDADCRLVSAGDASLLMEKMEVTRLRQ